MVGPFEELRVIYVGAEAVVKLVEWRGLKLVAKVRVPKPYRRPEVDQQVRSERTIREARAMIRAKRAGVPCPAVIHLELSTSTIYMQYVEGESLRAVLASGAEDFSEIANGLGTAMALLHSTGLYHGDLVPANVIVQEGMTYLIDFGLAGRSDDVEEHAIDYHLLERSLTAGFPLIASKFMEKVREGYGSVLGDAAVSGLLRRVEEIRARGRYVERGEHQV
ncbi:MAG: Kae1-associated kinase Bud32 [Thaumarchaeota archaeon]|nr:Kae1-associated kinase Bud32 [Candidatus Calditenuaceae archaeon]MDW8042066.1 Kae1-associated kinase Bud32 [Nitrososphaerota archaeon]